MNLRQYKKCSVIKMKALKIEDGDILILSANFDKGNIHPKLAEQFFNIAKRQIKKDIIPIVIPTDMFLEKSSKETLVAYVNKVQGYIDRLGE